MKNKNEIYMTNMKVRKKHQEETTLLLWSFFLRVLDAWGGGLLPRPLHKRLPSRPGDVHEAAEVSLVGVGRGHRGTRGSAQAIALSEEGHSVWWGVQGGGLVDLREEKNEIKI